MLNAANISIGSANIEMASQNAENQQLGQMIEQSGEQQDEKMLNNGISMQAELSEDVMEDTKKLLDDPNLGLTDKEKEQYMQDPQKLAEDLPGMKSNLTRQINKGGNLGKLISGIDGAIGERMQDGVEDDKDEYGGDPHTERRQKVRELLSSSIKGKDNKKEFDFVTSHADDKELAALEERGEMVSRRKLMDKVSSGLKDSGYYPPAIGASKDAGEGPAKVGTQAGPSNGTVPNGNASGKTLGNAAISGGNITINAGTVNMQGGGNIKSATGVERVIEEVTGSGTQDSGKDVNGKVDVADQITLDGSSEVSLRDKMKAFNGAFKNSGGIEQIGSLANDLIDGFNSLSSGLYVDGMAPTQEWNSNSQWRRANIADAGKKRQENVDRAKDNWAHDKTNINIMTEKYFPEEKDKALQKYGQQLKNGEVDMKYIEAKASESAKEKAKSAMKDMSAYVQYGVTDVNLAYDLYQNANNNGLSPEQSIRNMAGYQKFNKNSGNINQLNVSPNIKGNNYTSVEAAIPDAKTYYDAGYTNIDEMSWVHYMAEKLGKEPSFAIAVDEALKKKGKNGKLNYNGKDAEMKKVIDQINSHYGG